MTSPQNHNYCPIPLSIEYDIAQNNSGGGGGGGRGGGGGDVLPMTKMS